MTYYFYLEAYAPMASFRVPEAHTFQQTLPLPPVTTIKGLLGAAAGFSFQQAMEYCDEKEVKFGVTGKHGGKTKDLWKYRKIKSAETISAVLLRESLFDLNLSLFFVAEIENTVKQIREFFANPVYALTAGNSDDLLKIKRISEVIPCDIAGATEFSNTEFPGDLTGNYEVTIDIRAIPLMQEIYAPQTFILPTSFEFYGNERRISRRQAFTFTDIPIKLKKPFRSIIVNGKAVPLL